MNASPIYAKAALAFGLLAIGFSLGLLFVNAGHKRPTKTQHESPRSSKTVTKKSAKNGKGSHKAESSKRRPTPPLLLARTPIHGRPPGPAEYVKIVRVEAVPGEPFGVASLRIRIPRHSSWHADQPAEIRSSAGKVFYPTFAKTSDEENELVVRFLFKGTKSFRVQFQTVDPGLQIGCTVSPQGNLSERRQLLLDWWASFQASLGGLAGRDQQFIGDFFLDMLRRRLALPARMEPPSPETFQRLLQHRKEKSANLRDEWLDGLRSGERTVQEWNTWVDEVVDSENLAATSNHLEYYLGAGPFRRADLSRTELDGINLKHLDFEGALSFILVGAAYGRVGPRLFGKRPNGTIPALVVVLLFPFLLFTWSVWRLLVLTSREPGYAELTSNLVIGRRLLAHELPDDVDTVVDLTAEFIEPRAIRQSVAYRAFPILDADSPDPTELYDLANELRNMEGRIYLHCAQGHGRTALVAAMYLIVSQHVQSVEDAITAVQSVRPKARLNDGQIETIRLAAQRSPLRERGE